MVSKNTVNIRLESRHAATWREHTSGKAQIWIRGTLLFEDRFYLEDDAPAQFARIASLLNDANPYDFSTLLNQLNGFFSVVIQKDHTVFPAVDRVRSIPLFYGVVLGSVFFRNLLHPQTWRGTSS
ncbi:hypothetical protein ACFL0H_04560 [Thermodesulfobacteriota bacterium]